MNKLFLKKNPNKIFSGELYLYGPQDGDIQLKLSRERPNPKQKGVRHLVIRVTHSDLRWLPGNKIHFELRSPKIFHNATQWSLMRLRLKSKDPDLRPI